MAKLRVGIVNYLNSKPLAWGFLKNHHGDLFTPSFHSPARLARMLEQKSLDVGLIPSVEYQRIPGLRVIRDLCVAATQEVRSVLLVATRPFEEIRRVALDHNSRTSVALLHILLRERWGLEPESVEQHPDVERMLADADAALVIGDAALKVDRNRYRVMDLAAEWKTLTGHPFVFAVWAVRREIEFPDLAFYFKSSLRYGLASMDILVREAAAELELDPRSVHTYLSENLHYFLRWPELCGLHEFFRRAHALDLTPGVRDLDFWPED